MSATRIPEPLVLIVEDETDSRESLALLLRHEGYRVVTTANGQEALHYLRESPPPCLILLDMKMPVMNGWEFLRQQQAVEELARIPVLVISGRTDRPRSAVVRGTVAAFTKPIRIEALLEEIQQWCPCPLGRRNGSAGEEGEGAEQHARSDAAPGERGSRRAT